MLAYLYICAIMLVFNMLVRNASPGGPMCFRCMIFSLSEPCKMLFHFVLLPLGHELW